MEGKGGEERGEIRDEDPTIFYLCHQVDSKRIIDIVYIPPSAFCLQSPASTTTDTGTLFVTPTIRRTSKIGSSLSHLPAYLSTVWMGSQCGR
jgi:hypothetical protein